MTNDEHTNTSPATESVEYERPEIKDYGTLAELTAFKDERGSDWAHGQDEDGGGGYS